ncbi:MAG TPA: hypothetical protein VF642_03840 [Propionibacteriaceae bacterium]|jgi:hypothetical protein
MPLWTKGRALEIEVKEQSDIGFAFTVVRCRYGETYEEDISRFTDGWRIIFPA